MSDTSFETSVDLRSAPQRALDRIADVTIHIAVLALLGLVVVQGWQVFARYVINDSPSWTEPVTLLLLATAMSLGAATGVHTRRHFGFFLLAARMAPVVRRAVDVFASLVVAVLGVVIAGGLRCCCWTGWTSRPPARTCRRASTTCRCPLAVR